VTRPHNGAFFEQKYAESRAKAALRIEEAALS